MLLTVEFQAQWSYDLEFKEDSQWEYPVSIPQSKCSFIEDHPPRTLLPFFLPPLGSEFSSFSFFMFPPLSRQEVPWEANLRGERTSLMIYWKVWNAFKIWYLIIFPNRLHFLISIDFWPIFQKPSLRQTVPILQRWYSKIDAGLGVRHHGFQAWLCYFLDLVKVTDPPLHPAHPFPEFQSPICSEQGWGGDVQISSSTMIQYIREWFHFNCSRLNPICHISIQLFPFSLVILFHSVQINSNKLNSTDSNWIHDFRVS